MDALYAFLNPESTSETLDVYISSRFKDENGDLVPFRLKAITQEHNTLIMKQCTPPGRDKTGKEYPLDKLRYQNSLIVECCVIPDFKDSSICEAYGVVSPSDVPSKMLLVGEYAKLVEAIMEHCGFRNGDELLQEAKNS